MSSFFTIIAVRRSEIAVVYESFLFLNTTALAMFRADFCLYVVRVRC